MNTTLQIRIDKKTKEEAQKTFHTMGLDMSSGVKLYLTQVVNKKGIPFPIVGADYWPTQKKKRLIREAQDALKHGRSYRTAKELHTEILKKR